jgi:hypothetical protein
MSLTHAYRFMKETNARALAKQIAGKGTLPIIRPLIQLRRSGRFLLETCYSRQAIVEESTFLKEHGQDSPQWRDHLSKHMTGDPSSTRERRYYEAKQILDWMVLQKLLDGDHPIGFL